MQFYTVHEPPDAPVDRIDRAEALTFISDGFCKAAVVFGPLWLLANQLWIAFAGYVAIGAGLAFAVLAFGLSPAWISLMIGALNLGLGFEAASLQRWALERRGWRMLGTVSGRSLDECERRFLDSWLADQRAASPGAGTEGVAAGVGSQLAAMADGASGGRLGSLGRGGFLSGLRGGLFGAGSRR